MINNILEEDFKKISSLDIPWRKLYNKTILISGANGFIPSYLTKFLVFLNEDKKLKMNIITIARNREKMEEKFKDEINNELLKSVIQDISSPINIKTDINFIIHAASQASPKFYSIDPVGTLKANIFGTYNLLELARKNHVESFLFFSAGEIYGTIEGKKLTTEDDFGKLDPSETRSCYAESKRAGEVMCSSWFHQYNIPARIVRLYHTYGPGFKLDDGRVFADFVSNILNNQDIVLKSDGKTIRSFCYIADAAAGFFTILLKGKNGEAYNLANEKDTVSIKRLAKILVDLFPEKKLKIITKTREKDDNYVVSKIKTNKPSSLKLRKLGWETKYNLKEGFTRTIQSFIANH